MAVKTDVTYAWKLPIKGNSAAIPEEWSDWSHANDIDYLVETMM